MIFRVASFHPTIIFFSMFNYFKLITGNMHFVFLASDSAYYSQTGKKKQVTTQKFLIHLKCTLYPFVYFFTVFCCNDSLITRSVSSSQLSDIMTHLLQTTAH